MATQSLRLLTFSCAAALVALSSACSTGGNVDTEALYLDMFSEVQDCVTARGFTPPATLEDASADGIDPSDPAVIAYDECYGEVGSQSRFEELGAVSPSAADTENKAEYFAMWKCIEGEGYERVAPIPLNAPGGYPLLPNPVYFDAEDNDVAIEAFYETAADCGDMKVDDFRGPTGDLFFGTTECPAGETCATTDSYPTE